MGKKFWTEEKCIERALKFNHATDWQKGDFNSYMAAIGLNCYKACTKHMTRKPHKNKYEISELQESIKKYSSYHDFKNCEADKCRYILSKYTGISFFLGFPDYPRFYYFHEILGYAYACESRKEFKSKHPNLYSQANGKGWNDIIFKMCDYKDIDDFQDSRLTLCALTRERCRLVALRYDRRGDFSKYAGPEYRFARNQGKQFLDEICSHMVKYTWTKKRILESLDGFSDFEVWASQHPSAYDVALNKGLIEKIKVVLNN